MLNVESEVATVEQVVPVLLFVVLIRVEHLVLEAVVIVDGEVKLYSQLSSAVRRVGYSIEPDALEVGGTWGLDRALAECLEVVQVPYLAGLAHTFVI